MLRSLSLGQLDQLSLLSGVPRSTLIKLRYGQTPNPRLETVRQFMPHVTAARTAKE